MNIKKLCKCIYEENEGFKIGFLSNYEEINDIEPKNFIIENFNYIPSDQYRERLLMDYIPYLEKMLVSDWIFIQKQIHDPFNVFSFISFVTKFIRIDFYKYLVENKEIKNEILEYFYFKKNLHLLEYSYGDQLMLSMLGLRLKNFENLRNKFIEFGMEGLELIIFNKEDFSIEKQIDKLNEVDRALFEEQMNKVNRYFDELVKKYYP